MWSGDKLPYPTTYKPKNQRKTGLKANENINN